MTLHMRSHLARALHAFCAIPIAVVLLVTPILGQQAARSSQSQAALTVSVVVRSACIFDVTPRQAGGASVAVQCQASDLTHARIRVQDQTTLMRVAVSHVAGSPAMIRTEVRGGSVLQIDF